MVNYQAFSMYSSANRRTARQRAGTVVYVLYTAELFHVVARRGLRLHMYADDCQVYLSSPASDAATTIDVKNVFYVFYTGHVFYVF